LNKNFCGLLIFHLSLIKKHLIASAFFFKIIFMNIIFSSITHLDSVNSTNVYLMESDIPAPAVAYTFNQTAGRGRENRRWLDFSGKNLAISVSFEPAEKEIPLWRVAVLSIPAAEYLISLGVPDIWIKWPNDIYSADKKIAGALADSVFSDGKITRIVAGIGINVNLSADDLLAIDKKAESVYHASGILMDMERFTQEFIARLSLSLKNSSDLAWIKERWCDLSRMIGREFLWESPQGIVPGRALALNDDGTLVLETSSGTVTVAAGDIRIKM
jgi:BirA family transcriptional regulator, biotin operon repressor / biotin---[acetyl-CoA-carboxylase] ligase